MATSIVLRIPRTFNCSRTPFVRTLLSCSWCQKSYWYRQTRSLSHQRFLIRDRSAHLLYCQRHAAIPWLQRRLSSAGENGAESVSRVDVSADAPLPGASLPWATERGVGKSRGEQSTKLLLPPDQPPDARILRVAIVGTPNSGKSTLTNKLMGWHVTSVSKKVHTTRRTTLAVLTEGCSQLIFLDTPGMMHPREKRRHKLDRAIMTDAANSLETADIVGVIVDASHGFTRNQLDPVLLQALHLHDNIPSFLILNKTDAVKNKAALLAVTQRLTEGRVGGVPNPVLSKRKKETELDLQQLVEGADFKQSSPSSDKTVELREVHPQSNSSTASLSDLPESESVGLPESESVSLPESESVGLPESESVSEERAEVGNLQGETTTWDNYHERLMAARRAAANKSGWSNFDQVFMISALTGEGVDDIKEYLLAQARPGDWEFHSSLVTDQDPGSLALSCVWGKLLEFLPQEVPYHLFPEIALWEEDEDGILNIIIDIPTSNRRHFKFVLGRGGSTIKTVSGEAKQEIMNAFRCEIRLKLQARLVTRG